MSLCISCALRRTWHAAGAIIAVIAITTTVIIIIIIDVIIHPTPHHLIQFLNKGNTEILGRIIVGYVTVPCTAG